jgi:hypothetical protein
LNGAIDDHATGVYSVIRRSRGAVSGGLYAAPPILNLAIMDVDVDYIADTIEVPGHGLVSGAGPVYPTTDGALPGGIPASPTPLWLAVVDADTLALATSRDAAVLGAPIVDILDQGTGTLTLASSFPVQASIQPSDGAVLKDLAEGQRVEDVLLVLTREQLYVGRGYYEADLIEIEGERYRVDRCEHWNHWGETHHESLVVRVPIP